jgi:hypothetical protein
VKPYSKNNYSKKDWGMANVVEHLPSKYRILSLNPSTIKKKSVCVCVCVCVCVSITHLLKSIEEPGVVKCL